MEIYLNPIAYEMAAINKWKQLTELLNSQGVGASRSEEKWQKVWSDYKNQRSAQGTLCLTELEHRVLAIIGVQAAVGMAMPEIGFGTVEEMMNRIVPTDTSTEDVIIVTPATLIGDEDWNTPGSSKDAGPIPPCEFRAITPPSPKTSMSSPPKSSRRLSTPPLITRPNQRKRNRNVTPPPTTQRKRKRNVAQSMSVEEYFIKSDRSARDYARTRERMFVDSERERIRQSDYELQLQAQWLELMKEALKLFAKYMDEKNVRE